MSELSTKTPTNYEATMRWCNVWYEYRTFATAGGGEPIDIHRYLQQFRNPGSFTRFGKVVTKDNYILSIFRIQKAVEIDPGKCITTRLRRFIQKLCQKYLLLTGEMYERTN